jgi:hypothetical protein
LAYLYSEINFITAVKMSAKRNKQILKMANGPDLAQGATALLQTGKAELEPVRKFRSLACVGRAGELSTASIQVPTDLWGHRSDGGWSDVTETAWAVGCLDILGIWARVPGGLREESISWLKSGKTTEGAWGRSARDMTRIPVSGWMLTLLPELADERALGWLESEWRKDLGSETRLTYKGALTLKAFASVGRSPTDESLIPETVAYLVGEQNDDGGYGPWKNHPVGSEPWSTGIVLIGMTAWPELVPDGTLKKSLHWLGRTQLPNGLWPCHYIDEGSAYCYWGAVEAMKLLKRRGR